MRKARSTEEQITYVLSQAEAGMAVTELCRQLGVNQKTFYNRIILYA